MSKRFLIGAVAVIVAGIGLLAFLSWQEKASNQVTTSSKKEMAEAAAALGRTNAPAQAVLVPLDLSQPVRLAIGGLGLADNNQNQQLGDLITAELAGAPGFNLVERQSMDAILRELNLSLSGLVRAKDAVRAGKLLKADWFLLGTEAKLNGTNAIVIRVVDAHTGIMRDAGVVLENKSPDKLAADIAAFVRQSRQNAAQAKSRVYLAVGAFEDLSVNNRLADFPAQLRGYLIAAYQGGSVSLLEREYVDTLLREVRLDLAGLTEDSGAPVAMQSAFWLVTGQYQSYETTNLQVELNLDVQRIFGATKHITLRGLPGEPVGRQIKATIDETMNQNKGVIIPTLMSEVRAQMAIGKDLSQLNSRLGDLDFVWVTENWSLDPKVAAKQKRNLEEAVRAFETVLLLEPTNHEAKMYLARCLRNVTVYRLDEARNCYREIIEEPTQDKWPGLAQQALVDSFSNTSAEEKLRWFSMAVGNNTNPTVLEFYNQQMKLSESEIIIQNGDGPKARELAEARLFEEIAASFSVMQTGNGHGYSDFGMTDYVDTFGTNKSAAGLRLAELYPKMKVEFSELAPQLLDFVISYQTDTNTPLIVELERILDWQIEHPKEVYVSKYFRQESPVYLWSMEKKLYPLAVKAMERERRTDEVSNGEKFGEQDKIALGFAYVGVERWNDALEIFETFSNHPVSMTSDGPWGKAFMPMFPDKMASFCRQKLGMASVQNPLEFSMGIPLFCLCTPSTFITDDSGLWIGIKGQLLNLDFNFKTNLVVNLPMDDSVPITTICLTPSKIWI
jgi:tetratricopeptide (TPR) repeat protein